MSDPRVLPFKPVKKEPEHPVQFRFYVTIMSKQSVPVLEVLANHFRLCPETESTYFYQEPANVCQATHHKTGDYPTPVAMLKTRDVLSITKSGVSKNRIDVDAWLTAIGQVNGTIREISPEDIEALLDSVNIPRGNK